MFRILCCAIALAWLALYTSASAAEVSGTVQEPSIVWINDGSRADETLATMRNKDRQFVPGTIVIRAGMSVQFPNDDPIYHSIYSTSQLDPFDIGFYGFGPGKVVPFSKAGIVEVRCHIHTSMHGVIVVADGPSTQGLVKSFSFGDVLAGTHTLFMRDARGELKTKSIMVPSGRGRIDLGTLR